MWVDGPREKAENAKGLVFREFQPDCEEMEMGGLCVWVAVGCSCKIAYVAFVLTDAR